MNKLFLFALLAVTLASVMAYDYDEYLNDQEHMAEEDFHFRVKYIP